MAHLIEKLIKMCETNDPKVEEEPAEEQTPVQKVKPKINTSKRVNPQPLWWNKSCEEVRKERNRLRRVATKPDCTEDKKAKYQILDKKFKNITRKTKRRYLKRKQKSSEVEENLS